MLIHKDADTLHLQEIGLAFATAVALGFAHLDWNRDGEVRRVPAAIVMDAVNQWDQWENRPRRWTEGPPPGLGIIRWEQTFTGPTQPLSEPQSPSQPPPRPPETAPPEST